MRRHSRAKRSWCDGSLDGIEVVAPPAACNWPLDARWTIKVTLFRTDN
jgi:hypothetical protein